MRQLFGAFATVPAASIYTVGGGALVKPAGELVITNHPACLELLQAPLAQTC